MKPTVAALMAMVPAFTLGQDASSCKPPSISFRWVGTHAALMRTNARFDRQPAPPPAGGAAPQLAVATSSTTAGDIARIRILLPDGRDANVSKQQWNDLRTTRRFSINDTAGDSEQLFLVRFDDDDLLRDGGRVTLEFAGLSGCPSLVRIEDVIVLQQHFLRVDFGVAFIRDAAGGFSTHPELSMNAYSRWRGWVSGDVDLRLVKLEAIETPTNDPSSSPLTRGGSTLDTAGRILLNIDPGRKSWLHVFALEGSQPWAAIVLGGGLRTAPSATETDVRRRLFVGGRLQVLGYNAGAPAQSFADTRGFIELGYGWDQFWTGTPIAHGTHRLYAEGQLEIPSLGTKWIRVLARLKVDRPWEGYGASEVRFSLLSSIDPAAFGAFFGIAP